MFEELFEETSSSSGLKRLKLLESIILEHGLPQSKLLLADNKDCDAETFLPPHGKVISVETLLDALLLLYDECSNSSLRREKTVSDFINIGEWLSRQTNKKKGCSTHIHILLLHFSL